MIWLVLANTNNCKIYNYDKKNNDLIPIKNLNHSESKLKGIDLISDKPGHYKTDGGGRGTYSARQEPKEIEVDHFSSEIAKEIEMGRKKNDYKNVILIAAPHMHGLINQHLDKHTRTYIHDIQKEYNNLSVKELLALVKDIKFAEKD